MAIFPLTVLLVGLATLVATCSSLDNCPANTVVDIGQSLRWKFQLTGTSVTRIIINRYQDIAAEPRIVYRSDKNRSVDGYLPDISVNGSQITLELTIKATAFHFADIYGLEIDNTSQCYTTLSVMDSPECRHDVSASSHNVSCCVEHTGLMKPLITWNPELTRCFDSTTDVSHGRSFTTSVCELNNEDYQNIAGDSLTCLVQIDADLAPLSPRFAHRASRYIPVRSRSCQLLANFSFDVSTTSPTGPTLSTTPLPTKPESAQPTNPPTECDACCSPVGLVLTWYIAVIATMCLILLAYIAWRVNCKPCSTHRNHEPVSSSDTDDPSSSDADDRHHAAAAAAAAASGNGVSIEVPKKTKRRNKNPRHRGKSECSKIVT